VLHLVAAGCSTKQIAFRLEISEPTVKWHVSRLFTAFQVPNRAALVRAAAAKHALRRFPTEQPWIRGSDMRTRGAQLLLDPLVRALATALASRA
jgi:hypothetical protein